MQITLKKGFTLIEVIIVIVLVGIILAGASHLMVQGLKSFSSGKKIIDMEWQKSVAFEKMSRDIRAIRSPKDIVTATANIFTYVDTYGNLVTYRLNGASQIERVGQATNILADGIQTLIFSYYDNTGTITSTNTSIRYITATIGMNNLQTSITFHPWNLR